jgi:opacity protein-like surface antigen
MIVRSLQAAATTAMALLLADVPAARAGAAKAPPPPPPTFTWTGLYVGVNFGHAWGANRSISLDALNLLDLTGAGFGTASALGASGTAPARLDGLFAGGQLGYNWQFAEQFVAGFEADIQGAGLDGGGRLARVTPAPLAPPAAAVTGASLSRNLEYLATIRGRLGYAPAPAFLLYATGGVAYGGARARLELGQSLTPSPFGDAEIEGERYRNLTGFAVGGGLEAMLGTNVSAKLEYIYYDLGALRFGNDHINPLAYLDAASAVQLLDATSLSTRFSGHLLRAGANYRFDWSRPQTFGSAATPLFALNRPAPEEPQDEEEDPLQDSPNNVRRQLAEGKARRPALFPAGPLEPFHKAWEPVDKRLQEEIGLDLGLNYTSVYQNANRTLEDAQHEAASGDLDFLGSLRLNRPGERWPRSVAFATEWRRPFTLVPPGRLGQEIGSIWGTADGFNRQAYSLTELYFEQGSPEDGLMYRVGRMKPANVWNRGRYVSANHSFLNTTLSATPAMALPAAGFGAAAAAAIPEHGYVLVGVHDANGANNEVGNPERGEFFYALSLGVKRGEKKDQGGHYFVTLWRRDRLKLEDVPSGQGVAFHAEQAIGGEERLVPFLRYSYGYGAGLRVRQSLALGLGLEKPFGLSTDRFGLAFSWAEPAAGPKRDQYGIEAFYRLALTPDTQLTPDLQVIFNPADNPQAPSAIIGGVRLRTLF